MLSFFIISSLGFKLVPQVPPFAKCFLFLTPFTIADPIEDMGANLKFLAAIVGA